MARASALPAAGGDCRVPEPVDQGEARTAEVPCARFDESGVGTAVGGADLQSLLWRRLRQPPVARPFLPPAAETGGCLRESIHSHLQEPYATATHRAVQGAGANFDPSGS